METRIKDNDFYQNITSKGELIDELNTSLVQKLPHYKMLKKT